MAWDFETEPEFQRKLDRANEFVREEVEPLDLIWGHEVHKVNLEHEVGNL